MRRFEKGYSTTMAVVAVLVVVAIAAIGYGIYQKNHKTVAATVSVQKTTVFTGPTAAVDSANQQELSTESSSDTQATAADQTNSSSSDQAAANVGGAYNESAY